MTELPPEPATALEEPADVLDDGPGDDGQGDDEPVQVGDDYGAPDITALVAFVFAVGSFFGFGLTNGNYYLLLDLHQDPSRARGVFATVLGAAFALVPVVLGWRASARVLDSDARWVGSLARAAVVIGLTSMVLRLMIAILIAGTDAPNSYRF
jgi:hypothetical protein